jgi:hypothetical protein
MSSPADASVVASSARIERAVAFSTGDHSLAVMQRARGHLFGSALAAG